MDNRKITNADLAEIKKRANYVIENAEWQWGTLSTLIEDDVPSLIAEVDRLRKVVEYINDLSNEFYAEKDENDVWSIPDNERHKSTMQEIFVVSYEAVNEDD